MRNKDTVTCGCGAAQTASVFRAVDACAPCLSNGMDWNHWDSNVRHGRSGCRRACNAVYEAENSCDACTEWCGSDGCNRCGYTANSCPGNAASRCNRCGNSPCTCSSCNAYETASNSCGSASRCPQCGNNPCTCNTPAMVYETAHDLTLHTAEEAIRKGTLFSDLYMPMHGECADNCGAQLCDGQAEAFTAWELRLYLNTHPYDRHALEMFKRYARCADQPNYAGAFAFDDGCPERWSWTDAPWPWEFNAGCENHCGCN